MNKSGDGGTSLTHWDVFLAYAGPSARQRIVYASSRPILIAPRATRVRAISVAPSRMGNALLEGTKTAPEAMCARPTAVAPPRTGIASSPPAQTVPRVPRAFQAVAALLGRGNALPQPKRTASKAPGVLNMPLDGLRRLFREGWQVRRRKGCGLREEHILPGLPLLRGREGCLHPRS